MKVGDRVRVINDERWYFSYEGKVREINAKGNVVSFHATDPTLYGEYEDDELELVGEPS